MVKLASQPKTAACAQAHAFMEQLADIYDFVSPCFPPKYDMFRVIFRKYHEHMSFMLDCVGACAESLANADILKARCDFPRCAHHCSPRLAPVDR